MLIGVPFATLWPRFACSNDSGPGGSRAGHAAWGEGWEAAAAPAPGHAGEIVDGTDGDAPPPTAGLGCIPGNALLLCETRMDSENYRATEPIGRPPPSRNPPETANGNSATPVVSAVDGTVDGGADDADTVDDDGDLAGSSRSPPPIPREPANGTGRTATGQQHETPPSLSVKAAGKRPMNAGTGDGSPGDRSAVALSNSGQLTPGRCPMCAKPFASTVDSPTRALHVNSHFSENGPTMEETGTWICHVCSKDLSHMDTTRRSQHINRCMDAIESATGSGGGAAALSQNCPLCSKVLSLDRSRRVQHLKRCATKEGLSTAQLLTLLNGQQAHVEVAEPWHPAAEKIIKNIMTVGESPPTGEAVDGRLPRSATTDESPEFKQITRRGRGGGASGASGAVLDARRGKVSRKAPITEQVCPFYSTPDAPFSIPLPLLQTLKISGPVL